MGDKERKPMIYASEIGRYHFCPVAWYLQRCGYKTSSPFIHQGTQKHDMYGKALQKEMTSHRYMKWIIISGILGIALSFILYLFEGML